MSIPLHVEGCKSVIYTKHRQTIDLTKALAKLGSPAGQLIVYEAGPCVYALARELRAAGYRCEVVAPSKVPRRPGERVKTDRRPQAQQVRAADQEFQAIIVRAYPQAMTDEARGHGVEHLAQREAAREEDVAPGANNSPEGRTEIRDRG